MTNATVKLPLKDWDVVAQCLDLGIRQGGAQASRIIMPVIDQITSQIAANTTANAPTQNANPND